LLRCLSSELNLGRAVGTNLCWGFTRRTGLRITYQRDASRWQTAVPERGKKPATTQRFDVGWTDFKVLAVIWHDDDRVVVVSYRGGPWDFGLSGRRKVSP